MLYLVYASMGKSSSGNLERFSRKVCDLIVQRMSDFSQILKKSFGEQIVQTSCLPCKRWSVFCQAISSFSENASSFYVSAILTQKEK